MHSLAALSLAATLGIATAANATNGYTANGYGGNSKGMAGAGVAVPNGVLGLAQNPAMGTRIGNQAGLCLTFFAPDRAFSIEGNGPLQTGSFESTNDMFVIPCGGVNVEINDRSAFAFFVFGNGGMNTEYDTNIFVPGFGPAGTTPLGVDLKQAFITGNYAFDVTDTLTIGGGPIFVYQTFEAEGLENFAPFSQDPANLTNNGSDTSTGWGFSLGVVWDATERQTWKSIASPRSGEPTTS